MIATGAIINAGSPFVAAAPAWLGLGESLHLPQSHLP
jgi:hypothetical protein